MAKSDVLVRMKADTQNYDANIAKARRQLEAFKKDNLSLGGALKQTSSSLMGLAARYASVTAAITAFGSAIKNNIETARGFEKSMSQLSSLTGMVGADLAKLKDYAIELGSTTTLSASEVADAFKMIGSQQPQLLSSGEALKAVTKQAITLSEAAGIDLATAAQTLSTSINQMGGDSNNAARFVNVLAAASQKGAGDIAWLGEAVTKSGTTARAVGTEYEELVANLEQLAKAGFDASTAGTALRSIIMNLEKQANQDFKPSVVGLTKAFENLGEANLSVVEYQKIAGKMFASQAMALADAAGEARSMTEAITGTNTAEEQAKTNTDNLDGSLKSLSSAWEGFNLHLNSSNGLLRDVVDRLKDAVTWVDTTYQRIERWYNKFGWMLNPTKEGARDSFAAVAAAKWGNVAETPAATAVPPVAAVVAPQAGGGGGGGGTTTTTTKKTGTSDYDKVMASFTRERNRAIAGADSLKADPNKYFKSPFAMITEEDKRKMMEMKDVTVDLGDAMARLGEKQVTEDIAAKMQQMTKAAQAQKMALNLAGQAAQNFGAALESIGDPSAKAAGQVVSAIASIAMGFAMASSSANTAGTGWGWLAWLGAGLAAMTTTISTIHNLTGYAEGGMVNGSTYSGDMVPAMLNSGELVLNKAQQGNLASQLQGGGLQNLKLEGVVTGENLHIIHNRYLKRSGQGELVTW